MNGPTWLASCAGEGGDSCRSQCDGDGALFCAPSDLKTRWGGWNDDDHDNDQDDLVFINTETCLELNLNDL